MYAAGAYACRRERGCCFREEPGFLSFWGGFLFWAERMDERAVKGAGAGKPDGFAGMVLCGVWVLPVSKLYGMGKPMAAHG